MAKLILVAPLEKCPFGGMVAGYGCDDCGEKQRGDCRGIGATDNRAEYPINTIVEVNKVITLLEEYKENLKE